MKGITKILILTFILLVGSTVALGSNWDRGLHAYDTIYCLLTGCNMTGDLNIEDNLYVGSGTPDNSFFGTQGNLLVSRILEVSNGIWAKAQTYGYIFQAHDSDFEIIKLDLTGNAVFDGTNYFICDYVTNPFNDSFEGQFITIISSTPDYSGATGEIETLINSSCIQINVAAAGGATLPDATSFKYVAYPHPRFAVLDQGYISSVVGESSDSRFKIDVPNGTGFTAVYIDDTAGADQHQSLTIDTDSTDKNGVVGLNIFMSSSTGVDGINSEAIVLEGDATGFNNSVLTFIDIELIGAGLNNQVDALYISPLVTNIIKVGSSDEISSAYYNALNITANVKDDDVDIEVFTADNDVIYVGNTLNFTTMSVALSTESSRNLVFTYAYCNSSNDWETLPGVLDTTNGFATTGSLSFPNPNNRGTCNKETDGTPFSDTTNYTYIALTRTKNNVVTPPIIDRLDISGASTNMFLQEDILKLNPIDTAPELCTATILGAIYYDISEDDMCVCKSGGWVVMTDGSECT